MRLKWKVSKKSEILTLVTLGVFLTELDTLYFVVEIGI